MELGKPESFTAASQGAAYEEAAALARSTKGAQVAIVRRTGKDSGTITVVDAASYPNTRTHQPKGEGRMALPQDDFFAGTDLPVSRSVLSSLKQAGTDDDDLAEDLVKAISAVALMPGSDIWDMPKTAWLELPEDLRGRLSKMGVTADNVLSLTPEVYATCLTALCTGYTTESEKKSATVLVAALSSRGGLGKVMDHLSTACKPREFEAVMAVAADSPPGTRDTESRNGADSLCRELLTSREKPSPSTLSRVINAAKIPVDVMRAWLVDGINGETLDKTAKQVVARHTMGKP